MVDTENLIIGAGPYGLSIAAHLKEAGVPFQIRGKPMESWRTGMPKGMKLKSEAFASSLWDPRRKFTFEAYCKSKNAPYQRTGKIVELEEFLDYADWFQKQAVGEVLETRVKSVKQLEDRFLVENVDGTFTTCRRVILASGYISFRRIPKELEGLPGHLCTHSAFVHDLEVYRNKKVVVVGAGQAALEIAALLNEVGASVKIVARRKSLLWNAPSVPKAKSWFEWLLNPDSGLGTGWQSFAVSELPRVFRALFRSDKRQRFVATSWGPSGSAWVRERVEGKVRMLLGRKLMAATTDGNRVLLKLDGPEGHEVHKVDCIITATGFEVDFDRVEILCPELKRTIEREGKAPKLNASFETSVKNLFVVGMASAPTFGPVMRFMFGAKHAAAIITRRIVLRSRIDALSRAALRLLGGWSDAVYKQLPRSADPIQVEWPSPVSTQSIAFPGTAGLGPRMQPAHPDGAGADNQNENLIF